MVFFKCRDQGAVFFIFLLVATFAPTFFGFNGLPANAKVSAISFACSSVSGIPATIVVTRDGKHVPVIRWTSSVFNDAGWSPERRCQEVSARFDSFLKEGRLNYITTGRINGLPVICTARNNGAPCDGLLYTLKPGQNPTTALRNLLEIRVKARSPLNESSGSRLYVSLDDLVNKRSAGSVMPTDLAPSQAPKSRTINTDLF